MTNINGLSKTELQEKVMQRVQEASSDPVVFIDRFAYTYDPKTPPYHLMFRPFPFQKDLALEVKSAITDGYDIFIEKCREMGATYTVLDVLLWFWLYVDGSNFLIGSRKEDYVDNTGAADVSNKEESLFGKLEYTLRRLPPFMLPQGFDWKKHLTYMSLSNPANGNVITGESSNPNFSRGSRRTAILLDEFAFWDNDTAAWGATADTTRCRIVLTTPGIKPSKAKRLRFGKDGEQIKVITLPYHLDPRKDATWLENERKRRSNEDFGREIMINWETSVTGKVYEEIQHAKIGDYPYNPNWPLYQSWDFGLDGVAMGWWQTNPENGKPRLVEAYENSNKPIQFYYPFVGQPIDSTFQYTTEDIAAIERVKQFKKAVHYGDPDVSKRSLLTGTSTRQALEAVGVYVQTNTQSNDFASRREKTKVLLQQGIEVNLTPGTEQWLECMRNARYPQRQETTQATTPIVLPIHDWTSHHRTATEYYAVNYDPATEAYTQRQQAPPAWYSPNRSFNNPSMMRRGR